MPSLPTNPEYNIYIGARYVPKLCGDWENDVEYEPISVVNYQGNSYTSKTFVPAGTLPTDTDYWQNTGNYNAQIEQYRQEVANLQNTVNENTSNISDIDNKMKKSYEINPAIIFVGDSYGDSSGKWPDLVSNLIKKYDNTAITYNACVGGANFVNEDNNYLTNLQNIANTIEDKTTITKIVLCAGYNDQNQTIGTAANNFLNYCINTFPNAIVYIGFIGWTIDTNIQNRMSAVYQQYINLRSIGYIYLNGVENTLRQNNFFNSDGFHPNDLGQTELAKNIFNAMYSGYAECRYSDTVNPVALGNFNLPNTAYFRVDTISEMTLLNLLVFSVNFTGNIIGDGTTYQIFSVYDSVYQHQSVPANIFNVTLRIHDSSNDITTTAIFELDNGIISFRFRYYISGSAVTFSNGTIDFFNSKVAVRSL